MDSKISALPLVVAPTALDLFPVVQTLTNKAVTLGVLSSNLPNIGNKGVTSFVTQNHSSGIIPINKTIIKLTTASTYSLPDGSDGQLMIIVDSIGGSVVNTTASQFISATFTVGGSLTILFVTGLGWTIINKNLVVTS